MFDVLCQPSRRAGKVYDDVCGREQGLCVIRVCLFLAVHWYWILVGVGQRA